MNQYRRPQGLTSWRLTIWPLLLVLLCSAGCARPAGLQSDDSTDHADQHPVPFHEEGTALSGANDSAASQPNGQNAVPPNLPFHESQSLPAGTLIMVRLKAPIYAENPEANASFDATVDEPVEIGGNTLLPRGAPVAGHVESAQASNVRRDHGYVRLALNSMQLGGVNLPIQTSSLFVRGVPGAAQASHAKEPPTEDSPSVIRIEKGRRLTFRLTEPVFVVASQRPPSGR